MSRLIVVIFLCLMGTIRSFHVVRKFIHGRNKRHAFTMHALRDVWTNNGNLEKTICSPQFIFIGGKGGVGKTTSSSSIALAMSDQGHRTLVVSTDPAHSLGDALDIRLTPGHVSVVGSNNNLWALEIDAENELKVLQDQLAEFNSDWLAKKTGLPRDLIESIGVSELSSVLSNPPPGVDELVVLSKIFDYAKLSANGSSSSTFDRIVIDTAPTGHTLRLLALPDFLGLLSSKVLRLKSKLGGIFSLVGSFTGFGGGGGGGGGFDELFAVIDKVGKLQANMAKLANTFRDSAQTQFVVVTIPTKLSLEETKRLLTSLKSERMHTSTILCNQVLPSDASSKAYINGLHRRQQKSLSEMRHFVEENHFPVTITEVPYSATEITGIHGLKYFYSLAHASLTTDGNLDESRKLTIFGGKGGVGKTTSAASWAMKLCDSGKRTLVLSSDPAHSLGDALAMKLTGSPSFVHSDFGQSAGELWAMEIDPSAAMVEFKQLLTDDASKLHTDDSMSITKELSALVVDFNDPPPGIDEVVTMTKVVSLLEDGHRLPNGDIVHFDRIVLDTAPTGHTLRMLELPQFLQSTLQKVQSIHKKISGFTSLFSTFSSSRSRANRSTGEYLDMVLQRLQTLQRKTQILERLLHDASLTEFTVVTIPTEVAMAETKRLVQSLHSSGIAVRRLIVNQVLPLQATTSETFATKYVTDIRKGQQRILQELQTISEESKIPLVVLPSCEQEARTVPVLRDIANRLFPST